MKPLLRRNAAFLVLAALATACAAVIWFVLPHEREVTSLGIFLFKLLPFVFAVEAIARLDLELVKRWHLARVLIPVAFGIFFLYFVPKIFYYLDDYPTVYYHVLVLMPIIIAALALAYRLGGGSPGNVRRLGYAMLLIMISGLEDLAFLTLNDLSGTRYSPIPEVWDWASHMKVFLGHFPSKYEAYALIAVRLALAVFVLAAPTRWFERLNPWRGRGSAGAAPAAEAAPTERAAV